MQVAGVEAWAVEALLVIQAAVVTDLRSLILRVVRVQVAVAAVVAQAATHLVPSETAQAAALDYMVKVAMVLAALRAVAVAVADQVAATAVPVSVHASVFIRRVAPTVVPAPVVVLALVALCVSYGVQGAPFHLHVFSVYIHLLPHHLAHHLAHRRLIW
jgi:hypothetical protein